MAKIKYRKLEMSWAGENYDIPVSFDLINRIERHYSLTVLAQQIAGQSPALSHIAGVVAIMLRSAGADVSEDEVYHDLMTSGESKAKEMATALIMAAFPFDSEDAPKKTPPKKTPPAKKSAAGKPAQ